MSFPRYPKYKPSGVEWLGDVPEGWVVCAPKRRIKSAAGGTLIKGMCSDEFSEGLFPGFSASGQNVWLEEYAYDCPAIVLSAVGARCGKAFKADGHWGVVANTHCLFPLPNSDRDYLWYLTNQEDWWEKGGSAQPFVKVSETMARPWVFPPLPEQTAIAEFLDRETAKIDELVAEQRRLMELLKEKRQAVISHAVTKGLNPHAPMKPSGIEWLGEVPAGWKAMRFRYLTKQIVDGTHFTPTYVDEGVPFLRVTDITSPHLKLDEVKRIPQSEHDELIKRCRPIKGDLLLSKNGTIGVPQVVEWEWDFSIFVSLCLIKLKPALNVYFARYVFLSSTIEIQINEETKQSTVINLHLEKIAAFKFPVPPIEEQSAIVRYLDQELPKFDSLTAEAQRAIDLLQERRTALISAAVTGQIDVRQQSNTRGAD